LAKDETNESVNFSRPFFAEVHRMDQANYLAPCWSVGGISVGNYRNDAPTLGVSEPNALMPVYYVPVMLMPLPAQNAWQDGRHCINPPKRVGVVNSYDLRHRWETELNYAFHTISLYVPQAAFDELTEELGRPRIETLTCLPSEAIPDPTAYHLARALESIVDSNEDVPSLLADQILTAMRLHLSTRYGGLCLPATPQGCLTSLQIRNLKAIMLDEPRRNVRLAELAATCGMPLHTFERSFRKQFGKSPHQWLLAEKVAQARKLLTYTEIPLAGIALRCGFSDQAHLTRIFARIVGATPGVYRRARRH
jgi:AraC family transcriptional regulator